MKVLHLPTDVGGNSWGLSRGERSLGLLSEVLTLTQSKMGYPSDIKLYDENATPSRFYKLFKRVLAFFKIRSKYDVFHFNFGMSLIHLLQHPLFYHFDLPFYPKSAGLFVTYNGCDARQKYPTIQRSKIAACHNSECYGGMCNSGTKDLERQLGIKKMANYVKHMWAITPDLLHFLPPGKASFLPCSVSRFNNEIFLPKLQKKLKIVHAPTNQAAKGSSFILAALNKLQLKYPDSLEIELIQNLPFDQAVELYKQADIVIDQIVIGWYGAFAVETMLMGKPVIARIAMEDLKFVPSQMANELMQTIIHADPYTIYDVIERCLHDRSFLKQRAEASIAFANKWHHPKYLAGLTKEKYEGL
jgi:hypothetical protein